jgi:hypothetical protein
VCMRNCGGESGCLATCSRGHAGCIRRCEGRSENFTPLPLRMADRCGATQYSCSEPTPVCCYSPSGGYYCAKSLSDC